MQPNISVVAWPYYRPNSGDSDYHLGMVELLQDQIQLIDGTVSELYNNQVFDSKLMRDLVDKNGRFAVTENEVRRKIIAGIDKILSLAVAGIPTGSNEKWDSNFKAEIVQLGALLEIKVKLDKKTASPEQEHEEGAEKKEKEDFLSLRKQRTKTLKQKLELLVNTITCIVYSVIITTSERLTKRDLDAFDDALSKIVQKTSDEHEPIGKILSSIRTEINRAILAALANAGTCSAQSIMQAVVLLPKADDEKAPTQELLPEDLSPEKIRLKITEQARSSDANRTTLFPLAQQLSRVMKQTVSDKKKESPPQNLAIAVPDVRSSIVKALKEIQDQLKKEVATSEEDVDSSISKSERKFCSKYCETFFKQVAKHHGYGGACAWINQTYPDSGDGSKVFNLQLRLPDAGTLLTPADLKHIREDKKVKVVITLHEYHQFSLLGKGSFTYPVLQLLEQADHVIFFNKADQDAVNRDFERLIGKPVPFTASRSQVATNLTLSGIDEGVWERHKTGTTKEKKEAEKNIVMFGTIRAGKGFKYAVPLLKELIAHQEAEKESPLKQKKFDKTKLIIAGGVLDVETLAEIIFEANKLLSTKSEKSCENSISTADSEQRTYKMNFDDKNQIQNFLETVLLEHKDENQITVMKNISEQLNKRFAILPLEFKLCESADAVPKIFEQCRYAILTDDVKGFAHNASAMITPLTHGVICFANKGACSLDEDFTDKGGALIEHTLLSNPQRGVDGIFAKIEELEKDSGELAAQITRQQQYVDRLFSREAVGNTLQEAFAIALAENVQEKLEAYFKHELIKFGCDKEKVNGLVVGKSFEVNDDNLIETQMLLQEAFDRVTQESRPAAMRTTFAAAAAAVSAAPAAAVPTANRLERLTGIVAALIINLKNKNQEKQLKHH